MITTIDVMRYDGTGDATTATKVPVVIASFDVFGTADTPGSADREHLRRRILEMHGQWFAAEDEGRTEDPTEQKIRKSREEGKVAKSPDVSSAVVLLFSVVALGIVGDFMLRNTLDMVRFYLSRVSGFDNALGGVLMRGFFYYFIRISLPVAAVAFVAAIFGNVVQFGFLFTTKPIIPDFNRIAPRFDKWIQRSFLSTEAIYNFSRNLGKVIVIGVIAYVVVRSRFDQLTNLIRTPYAQAFGYIAETVFLLLLSAAVFLLVISLFDYLFQRHQHREQLKMTKQEVKEERKQFEGDPLIRNRLRQRMQEMMSRNIVQNVQSADVIVTNPTHFAVALQYDPDRMGAPTVTAKGQDETA
ncbi:MAG: EscU/YscU/HrcU family type III secretion system export apparatus switch protein, partial [Alkalispirochaeta sp.]